VTMRPRLVEEEIQKNRANKRVNPVRIEAIDHIFGGASVEIPMVRLIYTYCVIFAAHPEILRAGGDLKEKRGWLVPDPGTKHRTDKRLWSVAFCFSALYQSGAVDRGTFKYTDIHKGFIGKSVKWKYADRQSLRGWDPTRW